MPSKKNQATSYVTDKEYDQIIASAKKAGLSVSEFLRRVALGIEVKSVEDRKAVRELIALHADLGRLGGLLKMWLMNEDPDRNRVQGLLKELLAAKDELKKKILEL